MNVLTAVRRRLLEDPTIVGMTAGIDKSELKEDVAGTGKSRVVLTLSGSWRTTNQTARFPRLVVIVYADNTREGDTTTEDCYDRCLAVWDPIDAILHRPHTRDVVWGGANGVRVLFSNREIEPSPIEHPISTVGVVRVVYDMKIG